jgi:ER membrane protein complex subunit 1
MYLSLPALSVLLALPVAVRAVFEDEVGHIDYHHQLLGVPQRDTTFFHRPRPEDKASLLYTLSDLGVLGAVNPSTGAVVWRQLLHDDVTEVSGHLRAAADAKWVASALGCSVQTWDAMSGRNVWSLDFTGEVKDLEVMELTEHGRKDVLALHQEDGATVARRIHGDDGRVVWEFKAISSDIPLQVSTNSEKVFVVSLHGSLLSYTLKVTVLDTLTGKRLDEISIGTKGELQSEEDVMFVGANSAAPIVAWTDATKTKLNVNVLGTKGKNELPLLDDTVAVEIHAPHHVQSQPHFLVQSRTATANKADVYHIDLKSNAITKAYELPLLDGESAFSTSTSGTNVYFTRVTSDEVIITSSTSHGILGRWPLKGADAKAGGLHAVSEVIKKAEDNFAVRSAVVLDSDDWAMVRNGEVDWTRPEGLSGAVAATWAEIPESEDLAKTLDAEAHSNPIEAYIHRVQRHISDLQYLPAYLQAIPGRLLSSIVGSERSAGDSNTLARDSFGFNKLVVLATRRGKLYGIDAGNNGRIVWSKSARETPSTRPWNVRALHADDAKGIVTVRGANGEYIIVASGTGKTIETMSPGLWPPVESAALVDSDAGAWLLPIGVSGKIGEVPLQWAPKQVVVVRSGENELKGVTFEPKGSQAVEAPAWIFTPKQGQKIVNVATRPVHDPIASIGRVLGDRSVKYKYLNPNTLVVAAVDEVTSSLSVYLLDTVSGEILASATYAGVDAEKAITCALSENWFVCSFYGEYTLRESQGETLKGYQVVISDLYESELTNDRGPLGETSNFSSVDPIDIPTGPALPSVMSKAFVLSGPITSFAVTETRQGITTRQLLAYAPELHSIIGIPRLILEPRRVVGRDPTPAELEEGLTKYMPAVELDARMLITHERDVVGVQKIITAPAILESTSLVFAYGIDVFGTRVTPSMAFDVLGKGFNKVTLIGTVLALTVGVLALGPMVSLSVPSHLDSFNKIWY